MLNFVYGSSERIFLNTTIGCNAKCKYCYLPSLQKDTDSQRYKQSVDRVYEDLIKMSCYIGGEDGTILSLGCYSECMDAENLQQTRELLREIIPLGNRIQLATKQNIPEYMAKEIAELRKYESQVTIYISMPTVSYIEDIEPGTVPFKMRIFNLEICKKYEVPVVLYIKPFLKGITDGDLDKYVEIIQEYHIPVVVGSYLSVEQSENSKVGVGEGMLYERNEDVGVEKFVKHLEKFTNVYRHSVMCMLQKKQ